MPEKKKILIFSLAYVPFVGGAELAVKEITDRMPEYEFHMITHRFDRRWARCETIGNAKVFRVGWGRGDGSYYRQALGKFLFMPLAIWKALRLHRKNSYAVFWSLMASRASGPVFFLKLIYPRIPFFLTIQEGDTPEYAHRRAGAFRVIWRRVFRMADRIQVISTYLKDWCVREGADPSRITIVPNGIDVRVFTEQTHKHEERKTKTIITTSRLVRKNGIDILIRAVARLKKAIPDIKCLIIGDGPERKNLEHLAKEEGIDDIVQFLGAIPNSDIPKYLADADVFVRPSRSEGLGTSFLEAMAAGLPIIATPVGGIPDFLTDGVTGLFEKPEDADDCAKGIERILMDSQLRETIVNNASELIRTEYTWDIVSKKIGSILNEVICDTLKKRICVVSGIFPPDIGGSATYSATLLAKLPEHGIHAHVLTYGDTVAQDTIRNIKRISRSIPKGIRHIVFFFVCLWHMRSVDTVISADASMGGGLPAMLAAKVMQKRFIVRVTGEYAWEQGSLRFGITDSLDHFQTRWYHPLVEILRILEHILVKSSDVVLAPSEYLKRIIIQWGVQKDRIRVVYNAVSISSAVTHESARSRVEARKDLGIPNNERMLVSVGRLVPWKGFCELVEMMPLIQRVFSNAKLYIIGDGPDVERIKKTIVRLALGHAVVLVGHLDQNILAAYIHAADCFVLNTGYEGFSHQLIEALALGTPIATTRVGGNPEIIEDGITGRLVPYNDRDAFSNAVVEMLEHTELQERFGKEGIRRAHEFTVERMMRGIVEVL